MSKNKLATSLNSGKSNISGPNTPKRITYDSPYLKEPDTDFILSLVNEINLMRDTPKHYKESLKKYRIETDPKSGTTSILLKEGKVTLSNKDYQSVMDTLEKCKVKKLLKIDTGLNNVCERIYYSLIKQLKNFNHLDSDVYGEVLSYINEFGQPAGKVSFIIDNENQFPKHIIINNLLESQSFLNEKHKVMGVFQESKITIILLMRYFVPLNMTVDHLSDSCVEIEEDYIEEIEYEDHDIIEDNDLTVKGEWRSDIAKIEKSAKVSENENKDLVKTIFIRRTLFNGEVEQEVKEVKVEKNKFNKKSEYTGHANQSSVNKPVKKNLKLNDSSVNDKSNTNEKLKSSSLNKSVSSQAQVKNVKKDIKKPETKSTKSLKVVSVTPTKSNLKASASPSPSPTLNTNKKTINKKK